MRPQERDSDDEAEAAPKAAKPATPVSAVGSAPPPPQRRPPPMAPAPVKAYIATADLPSSEEEEEEREKVVRQVRGLTLEVRRHRGTAKTCAEAEDEHLR